MGKIRGRKKMRKEKGGRREEKEKEEEPLALDLAAFWVRQCSKNLARTLNGTAEVLPWYG